MVLSDWSRGLRDHHLCRDSLFRTWHLQRLWLAAVCHLVPTDRRRRSPEHPRRSRRWGLTWCSRPPTTHFQARRRSREHLRVLSLPLLPLAEPPQPPPQPLALLHRRHHELWYHGGCGLWLSQFLQQRLLALLAAPPRRRADTEYPLPLCAIGERAWGVGAAPPTAVAARGTAAVNVRGGRCPTGTLSGGSPVSRWGDGGRRVGWSCVFVIAIAVAVLPPPVAAVPPTVTSLRRRRSL